MNNPKNPSISIEFVELYKIDEIETHRVSGTIAVQYMIGGTEICMNISVTINNTDPDFLCVNFKEFTASMIEKILLNRACQVFSLIDTSKLA